MSRHRPILALTILLTLVLTGCGEPRVRIGGDTAGAPVTVSVAVQDEALEAIGDGPGFDRTVVVDGGSRFGFGVGGFHGGHSSGFGTGIGIGFGPSRTRDAEVTWRLLIGRTAGDDGYLDAELVEGEHTWTIPVDPGTELHVVLHASGGRRGVKAVGSVVAFEGLSIRVGITGAAAILTSSGPTAGP